MALVYTSRPNSITGVWGTAGTSSTVQRTGRTSVTNTPIKVVGPYVTLPGGVKFRRTTSYSRSRAELFAVSSGYGTARYKPGFGGGKTPFYRTDPASHWPDHPLDTGYGSRIWQGVFGVLNAISVPGFDSIMTSRVATYALSDLADNKAGLGENLLQLRQTIDLLKRPLAQVTKIARRIKREKSTFKKVVDKSINDLRKYGVRRAIADKYLEYVYGVLPLMQDAYGLVELAKQYGNRPLLLRGRGKATADRSAQYEAAGDPAEFSTDLKFSCTTRMTLWARVDPEYSALRALNQLGLLNPVGIAWEVTPLSFLIDWFVPIGPVLNAFTAPAGLIFVDGSESTRVRATGTYQWRWTGFFSTSAMQAGSASFTYSVDNILYNGYARRRVTAWPMPSFFLSYDPFRGDRALKAVALATSSLRIR